MSPDAIADAIREDTTAYFNQHDQEKVVQNQSDHNHTTQSQTCNYGCHIAFHWLGFCSSQLNECFCM